MTSGLLLLIATTLFRGAVELKTPPCADGGAFGILSHAKSRAGSHISDTADGRYAPTEAATVVPTFCEVRLIIPMSVPLGLRALAETVLEPLLVDFERSSWESLPPGLILRSRCLGDVESVEASSPFRDGGDALSLKICTVSVADDTHSKDDVILKDML